MEMEMKPMLVRYNEDRGDFEEVKEPYMTIGIETEEDYKMLLLLTEHVPANESKAMFADDVESFDDRKQFVHNLGFLLSQTREGVVSAELRDDDVVVIRFEDGGLQSVNVKCDSYMAIIRDVAKAIN